jgi:hypothetical protein
MPWTATIRSLVRSTAQVSPGARQGQRERGQHRADQIVGSQSYAANVGTRRPSGASPGSRQGSVFSREWLCLLGLVVALAAHDPLLGR